MATCEERFEIYEAKRFGKVTWEAFTDMSEKQMVEVIQHLSEEQRECFMGAVAKQEDGRKVRWAAKTKAEEELYDLIRKKELTREIVTTYMEETEVDLNSMDGMRLCTMLMVAARNNDTVLARALIEAKADVDVQYNRGHTALWWAAAAAGRADCVALLLDAQADVDLGSEQMGTPLHAAVVQGNMSCIVPLLDAKADVWAEHPSGSTPMEEVLRLIRNGQLKSDDIIGMFLQQSPNERGVTALMSAASKCNYGYYKVIPKLLEMGEDPELEDKNGMTALMMAMMPWEGEDDWEVENKMRAINLLRGDRTDAELNEMRRVLWFPKVPPPLKVLHLQTQRLLMA